MDERLQRESESLTSSWMQHDKEMLRTYLVAGVENPRINLQSILTRHFLTVALCGTAFQKLMEHELRFAIVLNWVRALLDESVGPEDWPAIRHALESGSDNAEGLTIPHFVSSVFGSLPAEAEGIILPNYLDELLKGRGPRTDEEYVSEEMLSTFQRAWAQVLSQEAPSGRTVLEVACGSANDYRFLEAFGLARLIEYTGLDLCEKNISNAKAMFPHARFAMGNALAIDAADGAFDYYLAQDLFEHLSPEALARALDECCRVARQGLCLGFFNLHEGDAHIIRPVDEYHWNMLSVPRLKEMLETRGFAAQVVHIDTFCRWRLSCDQTHNKNAYTFFAERPPCGSS